MKAVVLAGGLGTRLKPLTEAVNKHLLPIGPKPMIQWPLDYLVEQGFNELLVVVGRKGAEDVMETVRNGTSSTVSVYFAFQPTEGGIADALALAEGFVRGQKNFPVVLGDNVFRRSAHLARVMEHMRPNEALIFTRKVRPEKQLQLGVARLRGATAKITGFLDVAEVVEKPSTPIVNGEAVTGLYIYGEDVFDRIRHCTPSARGEMEITDVHNLYAKEGKLWALPWMGAWWDAGTLESYAEVNQAAWKGELK